AGPRATPAVRRLASEYEIDLAQVPASGEGGRVTREDVLHYIQQSRQHQPATQTTNGAAAKPAPPAAPAPPKPAPPSPPPLIAPAGARREERIPMSRRRQTIAQRLVEAQ